MPKREPLSTDKQVKQLKAESKPYEHSIADGHGLRIRVSPKQQAGSGGVVAVKTWFYRYRSRIETVREGRDGKTVGKIERIKIGNYPGMSLAKARQEVEYHRTIVVREGSAKHFRDANLKEKATANQARKAKQSRDAYTVGALANEFVEAISNPAHTDHYIQSWAEYERSLRKYVLPKVGDISAHELSRDTLKTKVLAPLREQGKVVLANRVLAYAKRCFNWGIEESKVESNPCAHIKKADEAGGRRPLTQTEIKRLLSNMPGSSLEPWYQDFLLLILLTGLRPSEAAEIQHSYIDEDRQLLTLPQTKGGRIKKKQRSFVIPLSEQVIVLIERRRNDSEWLFPSKTNPKRPIRGDRMQSPLREALPNLKVLPFTPACLRTTLATEISSVRDQDGIKITRFMKERLLNHADSSVTGVHYDQYEYLDEKRHWLEVWGAHVESLADKANIRAEAMNNV